MQRQNATHDVSEMCLRLPWTRSLDMWVVFLIMYRYTNITCREYILELMDGCQPCKSSYGNHYCSYGLFLDEIQPCQMSRGIAQTSSLLYLPVGYNLACWPPSLPIRLISQLSRSILSPRLWLGGFFAEKHIHPPSSSMRLALCPPQ